METSSSTDMGVYPDPMIERAENLELFTAYLMGEMRADEQTRLEEVLFADDQYYELLLATEDDLRYDYAQGVLDPLRRERFERRIAASPADREKLAFAGALVSALSAPPVAPRQEQTFQFVEEPAPLIVTTPAHAGAWDQQAGVTTVVTRSTGWRPSIPESWWRLRAAEGLSRIAKLVPQLVIEEVEELEPGAGTEPESVEVTSWRPVSRWRQLVRIGLTFVGTFLLASLGIIIVQTLRYQTQVRELKRELSLQKNFRSQTEQEKTRAMELARDLEIERSRRLMLEEEKTRRSRPVGEPTDAVPAAASFIVSPGLTRDSGKKPLIQLGDAERVKLQLNLKRPGDYQSYEALLKTAGGKLVWGQAGLRPSEFGPIKVLALTLLSRVIPPGDYRVEVKGLAPGGLAEQVDDYYFSVADR